MRPEATSLPRAVEKSTRAIVLQGQNAATEVKKEREPTRQRETRKKKQLKDRWTILMMKPLDDGRLVSIRPTRLPRRTADRLQRYIDCSRKDDENEDTG